MASWTTTPFHISSSFMWSLLCLILLIQSSYAWSSFGRHLDSTTQIYRDIPVDSLTDALVTKENSNLVNFDRAKDLLRQLENSPVCAQAPTRRLLTQCKSLKDSFTNQESARALENAKTIYGIRQAICETQQANADIPVFCGGFEPLTDTTDSRIEVFPQKDIGACLSAFRPDHAFWTSYSKFKQDATTLCDPARVDYQLEELLDIYRHLTNALPEVIEILQNQAEVSERYVTTIHRATEESLENVRLSKDHIQKQIEEHALHIALIGQNASELLHELQSFRDLVRSKTYEDIEEATESMIIFEQRSAAAQSNFASIFTSVAELLTGLGLKVEDLHSHLEPAKDVLLGIHELSDSGKIQEITKYSLDAVSAAHQFSILQNRQYVVANDQYEVMERTLNGQETSKTLLDDITGSLNELKTDMADFSHLVNSIASIYRNLHFKSVLLVAGITVLLVFIILARYPSIVTATCLFGTLLACEVLWWISSWRSQLRSIVLTPNVPIWLTSSLASIVTLIILCVILNRLSRRKLSAKQEIQTRVRMKHSLQGPRKFNYQPLRPERFVRACTLPPDIRV